MSSGQCNWQFCFTLPIWKRFSLLYHKGATHGTICHLRDPLPLLTPFAAIVTWPSRQCISILMPLANSVLKLNKPMNSIHLANCPLERRGAWPVLMWNFGPCKKWQNCFVNSTTAGSPFHVTQLFLWALVKVLPAKKQQGVPLHLLTNLKC